METEQDELSIVDAAARLGITPEVVRKRLQRGSLSGYKQDNRWVVLLHKQDTSQTATPEDQDSQQDTIRTEQDTNPVLTRLVQRYESEIEFLRAELSSRSEELRRKDVLLAQFAERLPELPATTTPASPHPANGSTQRPWWKFW